MFRENFKNLMIPESNQLWEFYTAFMLAYGPPPPWPADRTGDVQDLQRAFYAFARDVEFLKGVELQHIWGDFLWVSRNGALQDWKPDPLTPTNDPSKIR